MSIPTVGILNIFFLFWVGVGSWRGHCFQTMARFLTILSSKTWKCRRNGTAVTTVNTVLFRFRKTVTRTPVSVAKYRQPNRRDGGRLPVSRFPKGTSITYYTYLRRYRRIESSTAEYVSHGKWTGRCSFPRNFQTRRAMPLNVRTETMDDYVPTPFSNLFFALNHIASANFKNFLIAFQTNGLLVSTRLSLGRICRISNPYFSFFFFVNR